MILLAGGTGTLGGTLIHTHRDANTPFRILTRSSQRAAPLQEAGLDVAVGDAADRDGNINLMQAAEQSGVRQFVHFSTHGASASHPMELARMKYAAEQRLMAGAWSGLSSGPPPSLRPSPRSWVRR